MYAYIQICVCIENTTLEIPEMMSTTAAPDQWKHFRPQPEPEGKMVTGDVSKLQPGIQQGPMGSPVLSHLHPINLYEFIDRTDVKPPQCHTFNWALKIEKKAAHIPEV